MGHARSSLCSTGLSARQSLDLHFYSKQIDEVLPVSEVTVLSETTHVTFGLYHFISMKLRRPAWL